MKKKTFMKDGKVIPFDFRKVVEPVESELIETVATEVMGYFERKFGIKPDKYDFRLFFAGAYIKANQVMNNYSALKIRVQKELEKMELDFMTAEDCFLRILTSLYQDMIDYDNVS